MKLFPLASNLACSQPASQQSNQQPAKHTQATNNSNSQSESEPELELELELDINTGNGRQTNTSFGFESQPKPKRKWKRKRRLVDWRPLNLANLRPLLGLFGLVWFVFLYIATCFLVLNLNLILIVVLLLLLFSSLAHFCFGLVQLPSQASAI